MRNYYLYKKIVRLLFLLILTSEAGTVFSQNKTDTAFSKRDSSLRQEKITLLNKSQQKSQLLQSTATVYTNQLTTTPAPSFLQALPGRLSGLYTRQRSGVQDNDDPSSIIDFKIRGQNPLILIDGVPRNFSSIEPESIESITVLKDALSTVMYGQRSSNNIILVTTKRPVQTAFKLSATAQHGVQNLINLPKTVSAADYAILYNEARNNDGLAPTYTAADVLAYRNGTDPIGHPDNNYKDLFLNKNAYLDRYNINIQNGNNIARFYVALDYQNEDGFLRTSDVNSYSTNNNTNRYIVRSNIGIDLSKTLNVSLNVFGRIQNATQPGTASTTSAIYSAISATPNNAYPIFNQNASLGGSTRYNQNLWGLLNNSGYTKGTTRDLSTDIEATQKLEKWLPGLWIKGSISYNNTIDQTVNRSKTFAVYTLQNGANQTYNEVGTNGSQLNTFSFNSRRTYTYGKLSLGYDKIFNNHKVQALVLADQQSTTLDLQLPAIYTNFAGSATYSFKDKYFAESALSYGGFNRFKPGSRFGLFYAMGLGWDIAKEDFLKNVKWVNTIKPRVSYGRTGNSNVGYYIYDQYYEYGGTTAVYYFGQTPTSARGYTELALANPNATWEKANKLNIGLDVSLFNNHLSLTSEYFNDTYFDLMQVRGTSTQIIGQTYPAENVGKNRYTGLENSVSWNGKKGAFGYFVSGNLSLLKNRVIYQDEVAQTYAYQRSTGLPVGQTFGYIADGFYQSQAEINVSPRVDGFTPVPGDLKYRDLNDDGVINQFDQTAIGTQKPLIFYGLTTGFNIKGFDLSVSVQGVANRDILLSGTQEYEFQTGGNGQIFQHQLNRWTPSNATNATYPRLSLAAQANNLNQRNSTFWIHSSAYLRLQNVDLGYTLPVSFASKMKLSSIRVFANGFNLYSFDSLGHNDPENNNSVFPLRRTFNAGLNVKF
ncbi:SusC/RagA family TonB-linked outer membrane protein [Mucilaginibacter sp. PAMB04274]|uniref:SusC/RagA family TonB-linked outer membrane protein n=1 Tax=Mucilaginibacter sp. PAMB04274 TaxID=3138568 RepID=UPI0031F6D5F2